jgi:PEP-CTERM motif-containing protein
MAALSLVAADPGKSSAQTRSPLAGGLLFVPPTCCQGGLQAIECGQAETAVLILARRGMGTMRQARPLRYLPPMTMADILQPQLHENPDQQRKADKISRGRRTRFTVFVILCFIYGTSGICFATVVPAMLRHFSQAGSGTGSAVFASAEEAAAASKHAEENSGGYSSYSSGGGSSSAAAEAVPEPSSVILLGIGCAALGGAAIRRKLARRA